MSKNNRCGNCATKSDEQRCGDCPRKQKSKSLKIQGDLENGIYIVNDFYQPDNYLTENDIWICGLDFDFMKNSAIEITDDFIIDRIKNNPDIIKYIKHVDFVDHINNSVLNNKNIECIM